MSYKTYIIKSLAAERYYIGSTEDLEKRINLHNGCKAKWTKRYQPWVLIHFEEFDTRSEAVRRERFLKSLKNIKRFLESEGIESLRLPTGSSVG
ncbi:MAG TPA: GIY-YIG nuclease family protein [Ignavibacteriaceae bacterium]